MCWVAVAALCEGEEKSCSKSDILTGKKEGLGGGSVSLSGSIGLPLSRKRGGGAGQGGGGYLGDKKRRKRGLFFIREEEVAEKERASSRGGRIKEFPGEGEGKLAL